MTIIKKFEDKSLLEYANGQFDGWCIYLTRPSVQRYAPQDVNYFTRLQQLGKLYTSQKIYNDFVKIYNLTNSQINEGLLKQISEISEDYDKDSLEIDILFTIIYMGMVAEENKKHTKLGKRIKRLGLHQVLVEDVQAMRAANFSRGMGWREIDDECKRRGF